MDKKLLTIMTEPISTYARCRQLYREKIKKCSQYGGHPAVTRSLIEGLNKIGFEKYNYRPKSIQNIGEQVHVLAGIDTLKFALELKKRGVVRKITAGPAVVIFSDEYDSIIADENIDLYLQPSEWSAKLHIDIEPRLVSRCLPWPVGINVNEFYPGKKENRKRNVLIYHKCESNQFCWRADFLLRKYGYHTSIIKYGEYNLQEYRKLLLESEFAVVISRQESQGIFLTEAWGMDVPTICFDPHYYMFEKPRRYEVTEDISTCPYLSQATGLRFYEMNELENIIKNMEEIQKLFSPRKWVEENMTDEVCAKNFLNIVGIRTL